MTADEEPCLPKTSRFSFSSIPTNPIPDSNRPLWSTPAGSLDKFRFIHASSLSSNATYQPYHLPQVKLKGKHSIEALKSSSKFDIDTSGASEGMNEIPVYEYGKDFTGDPILFVESISEVGKKYGAVKVKMPSEVQAEHEINPDAFIFRTNRVINNPTENELCSRLRFYNELINFHTDMHRNQDETLDVDSSHNKQMQLDSMKSTGDESDGQETEVKFEPSHLEVKLDEIIAVEGPEVPIVKTEDQNKDVKAKSLILPLKEPSTEAGNSQQLKQSSRSKVPMFLAKVPMMDKRPLDLYEFFRLVIVRGGYNEVINKKLWAQIGRELGYKGRITSSLSTWLKMSYARILYPLEVNLGDRKFEVAALAQSNNEEEVQKRKKLNSGAPLILGSAKELQRSVRLKASKGFLLNAPHLMEIKSPLILGVKDAEIKVEGTKSKENQKENKPHTQRKTEETIMPITSVAQVNSFVKWLASGLSIMQDASRYDLTLKYSTSHSLKQFMDKDVKFQEFLVASYPEVFDMKDPSKRIDSSHAQAGLKNQQIGSIQRMARKTSAKDLERLYWNFIIHDGDFNLLDGMRLESGSCIPSSLVGSGFYQMGDDFSSYKEQLNESVVLGAYSQSQFNGGAQSDVPDGHQITSPGISTPVNNSRAATRSPSGDGTPLQPPNDSTPIESNTYPQLQGGNNYNSNGPIMNSTHVRSPKADVANPIHPDGPKSVAKALNPFNIHNIPILPNSLLGAYNSTDVNNRDLVNSTLNVGMTFSTENWKCEDHFTQLCNFHFFGAGRRWYFIPELEFDKFESLLAEVVEKLINNGEKSCINVNYREQNWHFDQLAKVINTEEDIANAEYDCLLKSLESMINAYPDVRVNHRSEIFQSLIDRRQQNRKNMVYNQEYLITPELLRENGINFTTTVQEAGEYIIKFPKTYSSTFSFGLNINEETNFASKLWLDYAEDGEIWLSKQGILPNVLIFKMLINLAQLYESSDLNFIHFDAEIYGKVLSLYAKLLDNELELRSKVRGAIKIKETTIDERNISESDNVSDDTLENAFPSKVVITELSSHQQFVMTLAGFLDYLSVIGNEDGSSVHDVVRDDDYSLELQMFYSDEKLKNFQRLLSSYSVDYEGWLKNYEELLKSDEDVTMKTYKSLLSDGWKIYSALSSSNDNFRRFSLGTQLENSELSEKIAIFKEEVENLQAFVDESTELIEDCQTILSLKHQQRIRNGGNDNTPQLNTELQGGGLQLLLELVNKIPKVNFYTPEFDQIFEFKSEIENFDRACRALIQKSNASNSELNDMISLGTSFGIQIPSLDFLRRLRDRQNWLLTYETIVSGGDPFSGKKDIFSLKDMISFRDDGLRVLASEDVEKMKAVDDYIVVGKAYDATVTAYLLQNNILNKVDLKELDTIIEDMVERSKKSGSDRLFVTLETYSRLLDLKAQSSHIKFLWEYPTMSHSLSSITQTLSDLETCGFRYDGSLIHNDLAKTHQWLDNANSLLKCAKVVNHSRSKQRLPPQATKHASDPELIKTAINIFNKCAITFAGEDVDDFTKSSSWIFMKNLDYIFDDKHPARYCMCRDYEDGVMIECDRCHEWYHLSCVNAKTDIGDENDKYSCPVCLLLEAYKTTGHISEIEGKISEDTLFKLIAKGESLRIVPQPELQLLKNITDLLQRVTEYFETQQNSDANVVHGSLYTMFLTRKFYGSPIHKPNQIFKLFSALKNVDLPSIFRAELKQRELQLAELQLAELQSQNQCIQGNELSSQMAIGESETPTFSVTINTKKPDGLENNVSLSCHEISGNINLETNQKETLKLTQVSLLTVQASSQTIESSLLTTCGSLPLIIDSANISDAFT